MTGPRLHRTAADRAMVSRILVWVGFGAVVLWARAPGPWVAASALPVLVLAALLAVRDLRRLASAAVLACGVGVALHTDQEVRVIEADWDAYWAERRAGTAHLLESEFGVAAAHGDASLERLLRVAEGWAEEEGRGALGDSIAAIVGETDLAAAVYGADGTLVAWRGQHHGRFPREALRGGVRHLYGGSPLFSYLYFVAPISDGDGSAVVAVLLHSELPAAHAAGLGDFATRFAGTSGERIAITAPGRTVGADRADLLWPDPPAVAFRIQEPDRKVRTLDRRGRGTAIVLALVALFWFVETLSRGGGVRPFSLGGLALAALLVPLEHLPLPPELTDPAYFELPGPLSPGLGRVLLLGVAAMPLAGLAAGRRHLRSMVAPVAVAAGYPLALQWLGGAVTSELMGGPDSRWIAVQGILALVLAVGSWPLLARSPAPGSAARPRMLGAAIVASALLSAAVGFGVRVGPGVPLALASLWCIPAWLFARGAGPDRRVSHQQWFFACWLAGTAVLPFAWSMRTEARQVIAERQMAGLGVTAAPYAADLGEGFASRADSLDRAGATDVEILYGSWVGSGLAEMGVPIFLTLWSPDGRPAEELRLGVAGDRPPVVDATLAELMAKGSWSYRRPAETDVHHLLAAPLQDGRLVTGAVPPRRSIGAPPTLAPLFASVEEAGNEEFLTLVRVDHDHEGAAGDTVGWRRNDEGWRGEGVARYPDGLHSVYYTISIPNVQVMLARATLVLGATFAPLMLLWLVAAATLGHPLATPIGWRELVHSFRARVTWTLFGFFVLSAALFGSLAYRALSGGSERTAKALAERIVHRTAASYGEEDGSMERLGRRLGADLLEYRDGELAAGSARELVELGLYEGWLDPAVSDVLDSNEQLAASTVESLGEWSYIVAHRRLHDGDVVAAPVPLPAGAAALRRRDVADLLLFAVVVGPVLSLGLALVVGRALAKPIQTLQAASEKVGQGNLDVSLPEDRVDEFGSVFAAFNRMVLGLGKARRELVESERIVAWGEMAKQVAHEVKNPLTPIKLSVQHLVRAWRDRPRDFAPILERNAGAILREIDRLAAIATSFSRLSSPGAEEQGPLVAVDAGDVVSEVLDLYRGGGESGIRVVGELPSGMPALECRPDELKEVLLNLIENSREAMPGGGVVRVRGARPTESQTMAALMVEDEGTGIPPELLPRVFEPQFSTRSKGSGLGLAVARRLVESWGGEIRVESEAGRGTRMIVRIPVRE